MVLFITRAQLVYSTGEGSLHQFERLLLGGKAQVVGVDETVGGNWKWLVVGVHVEQQSTEPCGRPFRWFRHLLCLPFSSTVNRRFHRIVQMNFVSDTSSVSITSLARSRRWLMVSYAAVRSMKATPVIWPSSKPFSMCWVRLSTCEQHDFPGLKPACCGISVSSIVH